MNAKVFVCIALAAFSLSYRMDAQDTIGVGVPTGTIRNDSYIAAGFEFFAPASGTTINALGFTSGGTLTIGAVPEPARLSLLPCALVGLLCLRRFRRNNNTQ